MIELCNETGQYPELLQESHLALSRQSLSSAYLTGSEEVVDFHFSTALSHFAQAKEQRELGQLCFINQDYDFLERVIESAPDTDPNSKQLTDVAMMLQAVGSCEAALKGFVKAGNVKQAIDWYRFLPCFAS